ncbi:MAG: sugar phosphate isomerase/epimerase [Chloroflexi bacterium]|nr:sugar phosphate isomerase/epimerase [Chloroflexota bacterium]
MRLGVNLMVWTGPFTDADVPLLERARRVGFEGVEVPLLALGCFDVARVRREIESLGLSCTTSAGVPRGCSLLDPSQRPRGLAWIREVLDITASLGATLLTGPLYAPVGELSGRGPLAAEWDSAVEALQEVAVLAERAGVVVSLEPLNRFETYFLNTAVDAVRLVEQVGSPHIGVQVDTFHMNIEEKSLPEAILRCGRHLQHVHCSENDRGIVGTGHVDWPGVVAALRAVGYDGWLTIESFGQPMPELAAAAAIWRPLAPSADVLAEESRRYLAHLVSTPG